MSTVRPKYDETLQQVREQQRSNKSSMYYKSPTDRFSRSWCPVYVSGFQPVIREEFVGESDRKQPVIQFVLALLCLFYCDNLLTVDQLLNFNVDVSSHYVFCMLQFKLKLEEFSQPVSPTDIVIYAEGDPVTSRNSCFDCRQLCTFGFNQTKQGAVATFTCFKLNIKIN